MDMKNIEKQTFRSLRRGNNGDLETTPNTPNIAENAVPHGSTIESSSRDENSILGTNKTPDEIKAEIDNRVTARINERLLAWSDANPGEIIPSNVIAEIESDCVREVNMAYKTVGGITSQINNEIGLSKCFDENNKERIDRYEGIKRVYMRQGYTESSIDLYLKAVNDEMKDIFKRVEALTPSEAAKVDMTYEAERAGVKHRGILTLADSKEIVEEPQVENVIDEIISKSEKEVDEHFPASPGKNVDPFAIVGGAAPSPTTSEVTADAFHKMESRHVEDIEIDTSVIQHASESTVEVKENHDEIPKIQETESESFAHLDSMMHFSKNKLLQVDPSQLRNMDPMMIRSMMNRRVGATWRNYLPASNYYGTFVESKEIGKASQMIELIGSELQGYSKTLEILRLIYNSLEIEASGYVSFEDFLTHTADADLDLIYLNSAIVNAPRNGDGANPLIPITGVRCVECDRSLALIKDATDPNGKKEQFEVDVVQLLKKAYPKKSVAKRIVDGNIISSNYTLDEANKRVEFGKEHKLELADETSVYRFILSIPSIRRSLNNAGKYRLHIQNETLQKLQNELTTNDDKDLKSLYAELLELGAEEFFDRMSAFASMLQDKKTDRMMKRRITKVLTYNGEALDESKETVDMMQYLTDIYIAPNREYLDNYLSVYPEISREDAMKMFSIHKTIDDLSISDAREIIQSLIPTSVYKEIRLKVNELSEIDDNSSVNITIKSEEIANSIIKPDLCSYTDEELVEHCIENGFDISIISKAVNNLKEGKCQCGCDTFTITTQELLFFSTAYQMRVESTKKFK